MACLEWNILVKALQDQAQRCAAAGAALDTPHVADAAVQVTERVLHEVDSVTALWEGLQTFIAQSEGWHTTAVRELQVSDVHSAVQAAADLLSVQAKGQAGTGDAVQRLQARLREFAAVQPLFEVR